MDNESEGNDKGGREEGQQESTATEEADDNASVSTDVDTTERKEENDDQVTRTQSPLGGTHHEASHSFEVDTESWGRSRGSILGGSINPIGSGRKRLKRRYLARKEEG